MWRNRDSGRDGAGGASAGGGDWSNTGTFLRKPPTGWLHEDSELMHGSFIDYEVYYLGCIEVKQSMRTLQFGVRTQVTKEAIVRLAEAAQKVFMGQKKRKVPKQIGKILGDVDARITGDMNLSVSVEALKINNPSSGGEVMNHSLPSISFASGGDGATLDFIGYVAKDPVHNRACHVFECPNSSQYVLATIGQAFELRYKIYLQGPRTNSQPVPLSDSAGSNSDVWTVGGTSGTSRYSRNEEAVTTPPAPPTPPPPSYEGLEDSTLGGIYSDIPDIPTSVPPPIPMSRSSGFNHFPPDLETVSCSQSPGGGVAMGGVTRLGNPYDTMPADVGLPSNGAHVYSDPGEVTSSSSTLKTNSLSTDDYEYTSAPLVTIKQRSMASDSDQIDLTPAPPSHDYSNIGPGGEIDPETKPHPPKPPRPPILAAKPTVKGAKYSPPQTRPQKPTHPKPQVRPKPPTVRHAPPTSAPPDSTSTHDSLYDDPDELEKAESQNTRPGTYDDVVEVMGRLDVGGVANGDEENVYDDVEAGDNVAIGRRAPLTSPKFDDTIYQTAGNGQARTNVVDPLAPLPHQPYFHGSISRVEAEALLVNNGEFLVRESTKKQGQYVLTGMASGKIQHLLLMDRHGKVKSRDREFESIPDLVRYFREKQSALIIGDSQVHLTTPVVNAFLS